MLVREVLQGMSEQGLRPLNALLGARRQATALAETAHRPWPLPEEPWFMGQTWQDLLFVHWPVPEDQLREVVPAPLPLDSFDGRVWLGITPFVVSRLRLRGTIPLPRVSRFAELNVRTYVTLEGRPGIYFLSLDAASQPAVSVARRFYRLPYFKANATADRLGHEIRYRSVRTSSDGPPASFGASYRPVGERFEAQPGTLERFLTERYCLYTLDENQRVLRAEIHHPPWPLQRADAELATNTMTEALGVDLREAPLLHFSHRQDVALWKVQPLASGSAS